MTNPTMTDADLLADGRPFIRCHCGFLAISDDQTRNLWALREHPCPAGVDVEVDRRWYDVAFSFWGVAIVFIVASAILAGMGVLR